MNEETLASTLAALAGPPPDVDAAWDDLAAWLADTGAPRRRRGPAIAAAAVAAAAVAIGTAVVLGGGDGDHTITVVPAVTPTTVAGDPLPVTAIPLVMTRGNALELWDGATLRETGQLTTAGAGHRITEVSLGDGIVVYTREDRRTGRRSIWRLDLATGARHEIASPGSHPAVSADGTKVVYVEGDGRGTDPLQRITVVDLATGAEQDLGVLNPTNDYRFEWSPDGTRFLFEPLGMHSVSIYEPGTITTLGVGPFWAASWIDDTHVLAETDDGAVSYDLATATTDPVAGLDADALATAVAPDGRIAVLADDTDTAEDGDRLLLPGPTPIDDVVDFDW